ncbi:cupin domain-containing protein [Streptomyces sp. NPDC051183]|uniref:cupin domain-containing protein n=1 Tax=unclassified Streptomyces TaxID=2593676 RepID=UPI00341BEE72
MGGRQSTARRPKEAAAVKAAAIRAAATGAAATGDLMAREVVIEPGGCTGWHYHRVPLIAVVKSGTLTRILHDNTVVVHRAGASFVEPAGRRHVHLGRNLGTEPVVLYVTCALADDAPFAVPAEAPHGAAPCACPGCPA